MSQLGIGVMMGLLSDDSHSVEAFQKNVGKVITALTIAEDRLLFTFEDGIKMKLFDNGQSCCERRYMHTDDDIQDFVGAVLQARNQCTRYRQPPQLAFSPFPPLLVGKLRISLNL